MPRHLLQLQFDPNQDYQRDAIQSVVDLFDGLPRFTSEFALGDDVVPNLPPHDDLSASMLYDNLRLIQEQHRANGMDIAPSMLLETETGLLLEGVGRDSWTYPSFTVEMETGTGKTYVYLRTIHELRKHYGFRKCIVVVPSIAIYEGVIKHFQITRSHFRALYGNEPVNPVRYDGSRLSTLRSFAASTFVEILVMTLDSFNKRTNVIFRPSDQLPGERLPFQYLQETRPILILDEPQNMESDTARAALRTLKPLFALRYSATHRSTPNLVYRLTPIEAFRRGLVKRIQVHAVTEREDYNQPFLELREIKTGPIRAIVRAHVTAQGRTREQDVVLSHAEDLSATTHRDEHRGYKVAEIHAGLGFVLFENGVRLHLSETIGPSRPDIFRAQIETTVERHMQRQQELLPLGVKVLSLFFIDRVANYTAPDALIRRLFDEAFEKYKLRFPHFSRFEPAQVRNAYFAERQTRGAAQPEAFDTGSRNAAERDAEKRAFELIMRDKERLLSLDEPVSFIFAHSALKEGWDNPNVFQICTLNQTVSQAKKRQEIGRGLRLAVDQAGVRLFDDQVNILTVVANESYASYCAGLQTEYVEEGQMPPPAPTRTGSTTVRRNETLYLDPRFRAFWDLLLRRTVYRLHVDTPALIDECVKRLNDAEFPQPRIVIERGAYVVTEFRLELLSVTGDRARIALTTRDTEGSEGSHTSAYEAGMLLAAVHHDDRLKGFKVHRIDPGPTPAVTFQNGVRLEPGLPYTFSSEAGQVPVQRVVQPTGHTYPIFNLLDRAQRDTGLTRPTLNAILRRMAGSKMAHLFRNPEGFATVFSTIIRGALADHILDRIEFLLPGDRAEQDLDRLFPGSQDLPQRELVPAGAHALYDQVQTDSDAEARFVRERLVPDDRVICYFKFPPKFRIPLPQIIGNYNPDWGILRYDQAGRVVLQLVRETKGTEELGALQFPHEKRKVLAARKHFRALGLDYRVITDQTPAWWLPSDDLPAQSGTGQPGSP